MSIFLWKSNKNNVIWAKQREGICYYVSHSQNINNMIMFLLYFLV